MKNQKEGNSGAGTPTQNPEWWTAVPAGERAVIQEIARFLRSARRSQRHDVAQAAAKWEHGLGCFIRVRLMHDRRARRRAAIQNQKAAA